jgi:hypothetical protein
MVNRLSPDFRLALVIAVIGLAIGMGALASAGATALQAF